MPESKIAMKVDEETKNLCKLAEKLEEVVKHEFDKGIENVDAKEMGEVIDMLKDVYEAKEKLVKACYYKQIMEAMEENDFDDEEDIMDYGRRYYDRNRYANGRFAPKGRGTRRGYDEPPYYHMMSVDDYRNMTPEQLRDIDREKGRLYFTPSSSGSGSMSGNSSGNSSGRSMGGSSDGNTRNFFEGYDDGQRRGYSDGYEQGSREGRSQGGRRDGREGRSGISRKTYMENKELHKGNSLEDKQAKMVSLEEWLKDMGNDVMEVVKDMTPEEKALTKTKLSTLVQKLA